jgi:hypothetical protein
MLIPSTRSDDAVCPLIAVLRRKVGIASSLAHRLMPGGLHDLTRRRPCHLLTMSKMYDSDRAM